jgi:hypothetical protein
VIDADILNYKNERFLISNKKRTFFNLELVCFLTIQTPRLGTAGLNISKK